MLLTCYIFLVIVFLLLIWSSLAFFASFIFCRSSLVIILIPFAWLYILKYNYLNSFFFKGSCIIFLYILNASRGLSSEYLNCCQNGTSLFIKALCYHLTNFFGFSVDYWLSSVSVYILNSKINHQERIQLMIRILNYSFCLSRYSIMPAIRAF